MTKRKVKESPSPGQISLNSMGRDSSVILPSSRVKNGFKTPSSNTSSFVLIEKGPFNDESPARRHENKQMSLAYFSDLLCMYALTYITHHLSIIIIKFHCHHHRDINYTRSIYSSSSSFSFLFKTNWYSLGFVPEYIQSETKSKH